MARFYHGKALVHLGRYDEALREYLWCLDMGAEEDRSFVGVQSTHLLAALASLGHEFAPAKTALLNHRKALERRLLADEGTPKDAHMLVAINHVVDPELSVKLYHRLKAGGVSRELVVEVWASLVLYLHETGRATEIADEVATTMEWIELTGSADALLYQLSGETSGMARVAGIQYIALLSRNTEEARRFASWVAASCPRIDVFAALIRYARSAGEEAEVEKLMSAARVALTSDEFGALERELAKL